MKTKLKESQKECIRLKETIEYQKGVIQSLKDTIKIREKLINSIHSDFKKYREEFSINYFLSPHKMDELNREIRLLQCQNKDTLDKFSKMCFFQFRMWRKKYLKSQKSKR